VPRQQGIWKSKGISFLLVWMQGARKLRLLCMRQRLRVALAVKTRKSGSQAILHLPVESR